MVPRERPFDDGPACWLCGVAVPPRRIDVESVLRVRSEGEGGPYREWSCGCGATAGALRNRAGDWLLHPLEGLEDPDLLDRLAPPHGRKAQEAAVAWWRRRRGDVERFRRATTPRQRTQTPPPRADRRRKRSRRAAADPPPPRAPRPPPEPPDIDSRSPHDLLGVAPGADAATIRTAYRKALKLCHPDRVANLDPEIQDVAHRKSKALRRAYERLLRDAGD